MSSCRSRTFESVCEFSPSHSRTVAVGSSPLTVREWAVLLDEADRLTGAGGDGCTDRLLGPLGRIFDPNGHVVVADVEYVRGGLDAERVPFATVLVDDQSWAWCGHQITQPGV